MDVHLGSLTGAHRARPGASSVHSVRRGRRKGRVVEALLTLSSWDRFAARPTIPASAAMRRQEADREVPCARHGSYVSSRRDEGSELPAPGPFSFPLARPERTGSTPGARECTVGSSRARRMQ